MAREKMHQEFLRINNDTMGMQHGGNNSTPRKFQKQKNFKSLSEVRQVSPFAWRDSDNRCSVLTLLTIEPNGQWRVVALPMHYPDSKFLGTGAQATINTLHLVSPHPIKSVQFDRQKVTKGPGLCDRYSPTPLTNKSITVATGQPELEHKAFTGNKSKWKELPKDYSHKSFPSSESSSPISISSSDNKPLAASIDDSNVDNVAKRSSRKKNRKKSKRGKKNQCQSSSSEPQASSQDHPQVGLISGTCGKNNVSYNDALVSSTTTLETPLQDNVGHEREDTLVEARPVSKKSSRNHSAGLFKKKPLPKDSAVSICGGLEDMNHSQVHSFGNSHSRDCNGRSHFSVLDPVLARPHSSHMYRTNNSQTPASSFQKGIFSCKNLSNDTVDSCRNAIEISNGSQRSNSRDMYPALDNRRNTPDKIFPQFSSVGRFGNVGNFRGRVGKENTRSVWQKIQKNESSCNSKSAPTSLQLDVSTEEKSLLERNIDYFEDAKQFKDIDSVKWSTTNRATSHEECKLCTQHECHADIVNSDGSYEVLGENLSISSDASDQNITGVSKSFPWNDSDYNSHSDMKSQMNGDLNHSLPMSCVSSDQAKVMEGQSPEFVPNGVSISAERGQENVPFADVGSCTQKWVVIDEKDRQSTNFTNSSSVEQSGNATSECKMNDDSENIVKKAEAVSISQTSEGTIHSSPNVEQKNRSVMVQCSNTVAGYSIVAEAADKIETAVNKAYSVQLESEAVEKVSGRPLSEFERVLHYSSPVICQPTNLVCHESLKDQLGTTSLCRHAKQSVSLDSLWNWYEEFGAFGLKVSGDDFENRKRVGEGCFQYTVYFTPYLSAIQLFKKRDNDSGDTNNNISSPEELTSSQLTETPDRSSNTDHLPESAYLAPQPRREFENSPTEAKISKIQQTPSNDAELLFEYFESRQPPQRQPIYELIKDLVSGDGNLRYRGLGDPSNLKNVKLDDLHPSSWFSVAWYPIYRIPEDTFRAAFLTYHSLGHLKRGSARFGSPSGQNSILCPAVGLQSYNAHNECWFNPQSSIPNHLKPASLDTNQSRILQERLRTLEETALYMSTASLTTGNLTYTNRHFDYEFFCLKKRY